MRFAIPERPLVSALVAVRNEERTLARALISVLAQDWPRESLEVLVVDGGSTDRTLAIAQAFAARDPRVRVLDNPARIVAAGLNRALAAARGDVIVRVDGHCTLPRGYLREAVGALRQGASCAGGPVRAVGSTPIARAIALAMSTPFGVGGATFRHASQGDAPREVDHLPFGVWPRALFTAVGAFDEALVRNQDDEFSDRVRRAGGRIVMLPRQVARYRSRATLAALARQYAGYGWWKVRVIARRGGRPASLRHLVPAAFVIAMAASAACLATPWAWLGAIIPALYAAFLVLASAHIARVHRSSEVVLLPIVLPVLHASYGLGFLAGLASPIAAARTTLAARSAATPLVDAEAHTEAA